MTHRAPRTAPRRPLRRSLLGAVVGVAVVLLVVGWPTGPRVTGAVAQSPDGASASLWVTLDECDGPVRVEVDERPGAIHLTTRRSGSSQGRGRSGCAGGALVGLREPLGDREVVDHSGWLRIGRRIPLTP